MLYNYDTEQKFIFYKSVIPDEVSAQGLLKAECDFYDNCWIYNYADIKEGMLAPDCIYNTAGGISVELACDTSNPHPYIELSYLPETAGSSFGLLFEVSDNHGRSWYYSYNIEEVEYAEEPEAFLGIQGSYPRLETVTDGASQQTIWQYDYYSPPLPYTIYNTAMPYALVSVTDRTGREVASIEYYGGGSSAGYPFATMHTFSRVRYITGEEGLLEYSYLVPGATITDGYCQQITKKVNGDQSTIYVDQNTGHITRIINPDLKEQKYCYHPSYNKIMYHKDESDNYTRYEYDFSRAGYPLKAVVRNACPFTEGSCAKKTCTNTELVWQYDYYNDSYGMPVKLKKILGPAGFQSWQYVYYDNNEPPNPKWSLKAIYRFEADPENGYIRKGGINDCADNNWATCKLVALYTYYENGLLSESTDANNNVTTYTYHLDGEIQSITYPPNNNTDIIYTYSYLYDAGDYFKKETLTDPLGNATDYYYDKYERIAKIHLPDPGNDAEDFDTYFEYEQPHTNPLLRCTIQTDANDKKTNLCYDAYNNLAEVIQDSERKKILTQYSYTDYNNKYTGLLQEITDANEYKTRYYYDRQRRLIGIDYPDIDAGMYCAAPHTGKKCDVRYAYYNNGLLHTKTDAKEQVITYSYDPLSRLINKGYSTGGGVIYTYYGQMLQNVQIKDSSDTVIRTTNYDYDEFFRLKDIGTPEGDLQYSYFDNDLLANYNLDGTMTVNYQYYGDGSIKQISNGTQTISYDYYKTGQKENIHYMPDSPPAIHYEYDAQGRLEEIINYKPNGSALLSKYTYTNDFHPDTAQQVYKGYRTKMVENIYGDEPVERTEKYYYDSLYQLTKTNYMDLGKI
ncbi:hypothetical protein A2Y85_03755 [candidate division WOR-3 bacterium RBG_13_43_14]|uniref:Insecticide toxin TcdB middle/N-terminal domain-containing protein n=1 Tax=candidate division WOR-3 bacterium RBG_13_43_14 TaxID=1802590 RepID=A0A1F4UFG1_UNCW3|nr:MAG: hypothetical protein A2Y85_03755 [candidate division WOR-3 bacterium RBG_13_43_14]